MTNYAYIFHYNNNEVKNMFKKVSIIIISIFSVLTIKYNVGYSLFIPIMVFYSLNDEHVRIIVETGHVHMNHKE